MTISEGVRRLAYQRQKPLAQAAQVIVCAHDSLFHLKPQAIGEVGLLVIDEAFWQSGLRGLDGKATLTQDGLEPGRTSLSCYTGKGKMDVGATADLGDHRLGSPASTAGSIATGTVSRRPFASTISIFAVLSALARADRGAGVPAGSSAPSINGMKAGGRATPSSPF